MDSLDSAQKDDLLKKISDTVEKKLGLAEKVVIRAAVTFARKNYSRDEMDRELSSLIDAKTAQSLASDIDYMIKSYIHKNKKSASPESASTKHARSKRSSKKDKSRKRQLPSDTVKNEENVKKEDDSRESIKKEPTAANVADFKPKSTADYVRMSLQSGPSMIDNLKKQIEDKKEQLRTAIASGKLDVLTNTSKLEKEISSKSHKAALLQLQIQQKIAAQKGLNFDDSQLSTGNQQPSKSAVKEGYRTLFNTPSRKEDITKSVHYDKRMKTNQPTRNRRVNLTFNEPGKYIQIADRIRTKEKLEILQQKVQSAAKKTGIASAAKFALVTTKQILNVDKIPKMEWWDNAILPFNTYAEFYAALESADNDSNFYREKLVGISNLIEHPIPKLPPDDPNDSTALPIYLTKKEQKKMRTQRRKLMEQEKQEKIRLGLMPPPPPKVKIANLMRVLGTEAVQDPTKVEAHVREQMMARQKKHEADNAERQLTDEQRRQKKIKKIKEDTSLGVHTSVFRVWDLSNPLKRFKVDKNAQQFYMTGCVLLLPDNMNLVIIESGPKAHKKFTHLMLNRIKWSEDSLNKDFSDQEVDDIDFVPNRCELVWTGIAKKRLFNDWKIKTLTTYSQAKEFLQSHSCEHYWDLVYTLSLDTDTPGTTNRSFQKVLAKHNYSPS